MIIQHNLPAMNSHRQMGINNNTTSKNLEKLSSGYKINRAGDDAAGLAISEKMRGQIRGLNMATQNANNGISLIQTAEGGLNETHDILQRMRELAVQSANGTYDDVTDRANLTKEVEALKEEINRISSATNYNGIKLLDGSLDPDNSIKKTAADYGIGTVTNGATMPKTGAYEISFTENADKTGFEATLKVDGQQVGNAVAVTETSADVDFGADGFKVVIDGKKIIDGVKESGAVNMAGKITTEATPAVPAKAEVDGEMTLGAIGGTAPQMFSVTAADYELDDVATGSSIGEGTYTVSIATDADDGTLSYKLFDDAGEEIEVTGTDITSGVLTLTTAGGDIKVSLDAGGNSNDTAFKTLMGQGSEISFTVDVASNASTVNDDVKVVTAALDNTFAEVNSTDVADWGFDPATLAVAEDTDGNITATSATITATYATDHLEYEMSIGAETLAGTYDSTNKKLTFETAAGDKISIGFDNAAVATALDTDLNSVSFDLAITAYVPEGPPSTTASIDSVTAGTGKSLTFQIGANGSEDQKVKLSVSDMSSVGLGVNGVSVKTQDEANSAIEALDKAINTVSGQRADLGALQNRLEHTVNNLGTTRENLQAAESSIRDVDMAKEMMEFTKNNILVQASQSMLAQSNQLPQGVLQLLR